MVGGHEKIGPFPKRIANTYCGHIYAWAELAKRRTADV